MSSLTDLQREKLRHVRKQVTHLGSTFTIHGRLGTFEYLGIIPDNVSTDMGAQGVSKQVQRPAGRRSRWLGDTNGSQVAGNTATVKFYPTKSGNAIPGTPITLINLDAIDEQTGNNHQGTLSIEGPLGGFFGWYNDNKPSFRVQIIGPSGKPYAGIVTPED